MFYLYSVIFFLNIILSKVTQIYYIRKFQKLTKYKIAKWILNKKDIVIINKLVQLAAFNIKSQYDKYIHYFGD